jgi:2-phospho-L-lactate guanylyltransferase
VTTGAFLIPLKAFERAKERLRTSADLDVPALAAALAAEVVRACSPVPVIVVTESPAVATWAEQLGAEVWLGDARGLNDALQEAYQGVAGRFARVTIVPGDLLFPQGLGDFRAGSGVTIVTDHHGTGTNLLALPTGEEFRFLFGPNSARRHLDEAERLGLTARVVTQGPWTRDADTPEDLEASPDSV